MDIHKPKPWHGLREFLKEYVIIVVGVLTALAAEQGVEWLHWKQKTGGAETQIARELSASWANAQERIAVTDCLDRRLNQIEDRLLQPAGKWTPLPPMVSGNGSEFVFYGPGRNWSDDVWRSLVADGTIGHLPHDRQIRLGRMYDNIAKLDMWNQEQLQEYGELNVLRRPLFLDNQQRVALAGSVERARIRASASYSLAKQAFQIVPTLIQVTPAAKRTASMSSPVAKTCKSLGLL